MNIIRPRDLRQNDIAAALARLAGPDAVTPADCARKLVEAAAAIAFGEDIDIQSLYDDLDAVQNCPLQKPESAIGLAGLALLTYAGVKQISAETAERDEFAKVIARLPESLRARMKDANISGVVEGEAA